MKGFAAIYITVLVLAVSLTVAGSLTLVTLQEQKRSANAELSLAAFGAAEGGVEDALVRVVKAMNWSSPYEVAGAEVSISAAVGGSRTITSRGSSEGRVRALEAELGTPVDFFSLVYGAQVGDGGLVMQNSSVVEGNVFSNGDITGNNSPRITGDALAAEDSVIDGVDVDGSAQARIVRNGQIGKSATASDELTGLTVGENAKATNRFHNGTVGLDAAADILTFCTIGGDATYETQNTCTVGGISSEQSVPVVPDLDPVAMPVPDSTIAEWKQEAQNGGSIVCEDGAYEPENQEVLGPVRIACDLEITGSKEVFVGGFVWVEGDVVIKNQAVVRLEPSFGNLSSALVADDPAEPDEKGTIRIQNQASVEGSGDEDSYLMLVSMNTGAESGESAKAIEVENSSSSSVYYAPRGAVLVKNNTSLVEVTGWKLELANSAVLSYESGLASLQFSGDPDAGWERRGWKEVE